MHPKDLSINFKNYKKNQNWYSNPYPKTENFVLYFKLHYSKFDICQIPKPKIQIPKKWNNKPRPKPLAFLGAYVRCVLRISSSRSTKWSNSLGSKIKSSIWDYFIFNISFVHVGKRSRCWAPRPSPLTTPRTASSSRACSTPSGSRSRSGRSWRRCAVPSSSASRWATRVWCGPRTCCRARPWRSCTTTATWRSTWR